MKLESNKKIYLFLFSFIGLYLVLILFIIFPLIGEIKENSQQLLSEKETQLSFSEEKKNLQDFKTIHREIEPDLEKVEDLFANLDVPIESIYFLEETASSSNVLIKISSIVLNEKKEPWPFLDFHLQTFSSFSNFSKFIERLENSPYLIEIYDLNIRKLANQDLGTKELAEFSLEDVAAVFSLKIFAK